MTRSFPRLITLGAAAGGLVVLGVARLLTGHVGLLDWMALIAGLVLGGNLLIIATAPPMVNTEGRRVRGWQWVDEGRARAVPDPVSTADELPDPVESAWDLPLL